MKPGTINAFALAAALGLASAVFAAEASAAAPAAAAAAAAPVTMSGKVMCAKCTLKKAGEKECADVVVVAGEKGATTEYFVVKNAVADKFGHQCQGEKAVKVTGTVSEKDGKKWITATKMEAGS